MSFLRTRRFFSKPARLLNPAGFFFELILLLILAFLNFLAVPDLERLNGGASPVEVSPASMSMIFSVGLYGVRISFFIAALRRNRMPQTAEWIVSLGGICFLFLGIMFGAIFLDLYAQVRGYSFCSTYSRGRLAVDVFALRGDACPGR